MQHTPPPPPPGHWGTYRVPTGILTAAAHRHPANPSFAAFQPQRGVSPYTRPSASYQPQPTFPPQPPQIQSTVPSHSSPPRPPPTRSFQTPPLPSDFVPSEQYHDCKVVYGYDLPKAVRTTTYTQCRLPYRDSPSFGHRPTGSVTYATDMKFFPSLPSTFPKQCSPQSYSPDSTTTRLTSTLLPSHIVKVPSHLFPIQPRSRPWQHWQTNSTNT